MLSIILEKVYHSSFKDLITDKISAPLDLKNTYYGSEISLNNTESNSYTYKNDWVKETETNMSIPMGAGSIVSTPGDLNKFIEALFNLKFVSKKSLDMMTTMKDTYGMGLLAFPYDNKQGYGHGGNIDGFNAIAIYLPEEKLALAITSNAIDYNMNTLAKDIFNCYFNKLFELPSFNEIEITATDLEKYIGTYSSEQLPGKFKITLKNNVLYVQLNDGPKDKLTYKGKHKFTNEVIGADFIFNPASNQLTLIQPMVEDAYLFTKE